jgi:Raf kinase inhibitor-like YbhB/YbcL family protein
MRSLATRALGRFTLLLPLLLAGCVERVDAKGEQVKVMEGGGGGTTMMTLTSTAFAPNGEIPAEHTCEGADRSPPLTWTSLPPGTKSLALVIDDPDAPDPRAPQRTWVHWVVYDIPPSATGSPAAGLPQGARQGKNDWNLARYGGPCPPIGRHRYFHKLYALDVKLGDIGEPTKAELEKAMQGHVLGHAELIGTYEKKQRR